MKHKIAAVIVLFQPDDDVLDNISSYIDDIDILFAVDNSESKNLTLIEKLKRIEKVQYIDNKGNQGVASALNIGANRAIENSYTYLLTMDQDSHFKSNDFNRFLASIDFNDETVGIYAPLSFPDERTRYPFYDLACITSGSLHNLNIYKKIGPFKDDLFIDGVDVEYCLRMNKNGFQLKRVPSIVLEHQLGDIKRYTFLFWEFSPTNHSALRKYYMTRNRFYIWEKFKNDFPEFIRFEQKSAIKEMIKIFLTEDNKFGKLKMTIRGYLDYKKRRYGKYSDV